MSEARCRAWSRIRWLIVLVAFLTGGAVYAVQVIYGLPWIPSLGLAMYAGGGVGALGGVFALIAMLYQDGLGRPGSRRGR